MHSSASNPSSLSLMSTTTNMENHKNHIHTLQYWKTALSEPTHWCQHYLEFIATTKQLSTLQIKMSDSSKGQDTPNLAMIPMTNTGFLNITWQSDKHLVNVAQTSLADLPTCHMQGIKINAQQTLKQLCDITCTNKTKHCLYGCIHYMLHDFLVSGIVLQQLLLEILRKASL